MPHYEADDGQPAFEGPEPIAIIGMGCRWPGQVNNPSQLWGLLKDKRDGWTEFDSDRINIDGFYHPNGSRLGSMHHKGGHHLRDDPRKFDHTFFGITATEITSMDPSQRKLLEVTYDAFDSAGQTLDQVSGSRTGVYVGNFNNDHFSMQVSDLDHTLPYVTTGGGPTILSNRINYVFNLLGPSSVIDTGCSASMYALHAAVLSLRNGDCDAAVVAGSNIITGPAGQIFGTKMGALSPTSRCHTFDEAADGYSRAEGFGALYVKKLSDALANNDPIRAVVRGTAINSNGKTGGISHPSPEGQEAVIRQAYKNAGLDFNDTGYFECHGTGTPVGDPIEVSALGRVFSPGRKDDDPLLIGSIKPNIGHSEAASAMSQIMKCVLSMEHGEIPATIRIEKFNPAIDFATARAKVVTDMTPWPKDRLLRASVNSFGYGGANSHCIIEHPSVIFEERERQRSIGSAQRNLQNNALANGLTQTPATNGHLSNGHNLNGNGTADGHAGNAYPIGDPANGYTNGQGVNGPQPMEQPIEQPPRDQSPTESCADGHTNHADRHQPGAQKIIGNVTPPSSPKDSASRLGLNRHWNKAPTLHQVQGADIRSYSLLPLSSHNETALKFNLAALSESLPGLDLADALYTLAAKKSTFSCRAFAVGESSTIKSSLSHDDIISEKTPRSPAKRLGFVFTGQGAQWPEMGAKLFNEYGAFRHTIRYLDDVLSQLHQEPPWSLEELLLESSETSRVHQPAVSQTLCTALQIALVNLLRHWGIEPVATVGHSSGEIGAAFTAGHLRASEAIVIAYCRGQAVTMNQRKGKMLAVGLGPEAVLPYLDESTDHVKVAAVNSPSSITLSGEPESVEKIAERLSAEKVFNRLLKTGDNAYHSHHMLALGQIYEDLVTSALTDVEFITKSESSGPTIRMVSSVMPQEGNPDASAGYWRKNLESPVLFSQAVETLVQEVPVDLMIEIGPHPALGGPLKQIRSELDQKGLRLPRCLGSLRRGEHDVVSMLKLAGNLYLQNAPVNLVAVNAVEHTEDGEVHLEHGSHCLGLPQYQFAYPDQPLFYEGRPSREYRQRKHPRHDLLGSRIPATSKANPSWRNILRVKDLPWLEHHSLSSSPVFPAAAYMTMAIEAARQLHLEDAEAATAGSFTLRHVSIHAPLRLNDNDLGVEVVLNMEKLALTDANLASGWYKFSVGSILPNSEDWTEHCSGTIMANTRDITIDDDRQLRQDSRSRSLDMQRWYDRFSSMGLNYGSSFQGLSKLKAYRGSNTAAADVDLCPTRDTTSGESEYPLHPAALDTCLQLALISSHAGQVENAANAFVPVLFDEATVWVPDTADDVARGVATGKRLGQRSLYADAQLFLSSGKPLLDIQQVKCYSYDGAAMDADSVASTREPYWRAVVRIDIDSLTSDRASALLPPLPFAESKSKALQSFFASSITQMSRKVEELSVESKSENHDQFRAWLASVTSTLDVSNLEEPMRLVEKSTVNLQDVPEVQCMNALSQNIHDILSGETNSLEVLMRGCPLNEMEASGFLVQGGHQQLCGLVDLLAHKSPRMNILELCAETGGASKSVLDILGSRSDFKRYQQYTFTDARPMFVADAENTFSGHRGLFFKTLDIHEDPIAQGFEAGSFDLVIAAASTRQLDESALGHVRSLLTPTGKLALLQTTRPTLASEFFSRTLSGNWDGEGLSSSESQWSSILHKTGFSGIDIEVPDYVEGNHITTVMLSTVSPVPAPADSTSGCDVYLLHGDTQSPLVETVRSTLSSRGYTAVPINIFSSPTIPSGASAISLVDVNNVTLLRGDEAHFHAVQSSVINSSTLVWLSGHSGASAVPDASTMRGALRVIATERIDSKFSFIELDEDWKITQDKTAGLVVNKYIELEKSTSRAAVDADCVLRDGMLWIERLLPDEELNEEFRLRQGLDDDLAEAPVKSLGPVRTKYSQPGVLSSLYFEADTDFYEPLKQDWIEFKTEAIGHNMKDIAVATGKFDHRYSSIEAAGTITKVGSDVSDLKIGDRVFGIVFGNMGNFMRSPASMVTKVPEGESAIGAATMSISYLTALYALDYLGRLSDGESVLIQYATGGLGMAAVRVAQNLGAEIYATAGSDEKRHLLIEKFGIPSDHVFDSRSQESIHQIMRATGRRGVDVVLCSSAGTMMHETWRCVAPQGRFIEVGRTNILGNGQLSMDVFKRNATFSSFDITMVYEQKPKLYQKLLKQLTGLWTAGAIGPIDPVTAYDISELESAMSYFSKGLHMGKIVITYQNPEAVIKVKQTTERATFDPNAAYIMVGALGGLGRSIATWMVERGAKHLVFMSRSGMDKPEASLLMKDLQEMGAAPEAIKCSILDQADLSRTIDTVASRFPVRGVLQAAMVEGDTPFDKASYSQFQDTLAPKVTGTLNLHHATKGLPLDFFVMASSITSLVGTATQSAYVAANSFQDSFARFRLSQGLPATALNIGLILEIGAAVNSAAFQKSFQRSVTYGISETEFLELVEGAFCASMSSSSREGDPLSRLDSGYRAQIATGLEPSRFVPFVKEHRMEDLLWHNNPRFAPVVQAIHDRAYAQDSGETSASGTGPSIAKQLETATSTAEREAIASTALVERLAGLLGMGAGDIDAERPMVDYGLDSLVATELRGWLMKTFGVDVNPLQLLSKTAKASSLVKLLIPA